MISNKFRMLCTACSFTLLVLNGTPLLAYENWQDYHDFINKGTILEHQNKWKQIHWQKDIEEARLRAGLENKPILIFMLIGYKDQQGASDG
ncbi:MAG: hypothetical protein SFV17_06210 [Candidatus Obscuribacter sp.]|nr:hypothetical protein [Candidatus Melainabacteria bacterium]MDX1986261.1 hypothetical protein [Candidatus Obscuribacter sp.]